MDAPTLRDYARHATAIAREAGQILRDRFGQPHEVRYKGPLDMVTEADQQSEALIAGRLRTLFPGHDLIGEEGSRGNAQESRYRWVIDPLDGTSNFAHGLPIFAVSIGLEENGRPIVGVVYDPMRDELFAACDGAGATLNGAPIRVSQTATLIGSLVSTGFSYDVGRRARQAATWCDVLPRVQSIRQLGAAALHLCYVAAGRLDAFWEFDIAQWDISAGALMVIESGGRVTRLAGDPFVTTAREVLATNGPIHDQLLPIVAASADHSLHPTGSGE